jgi:hypothetical protein
MARQGIHFSAPSSMNVTLCLEKSNSKLVVTKTREADCAEVLGEASSPFSEDGFWLQVTAMANKTNRKSALNLFMIETPLKD